MVAKYEKYGNDLKTLKALVCEYARAEYDSFFRGEFYRDQDGHELNIYNASKAQGYTRYNLGTSKMSYEDFGKAVKKLFAGTAAEEDGRYLQMMKEFGEQRFLRRLKTSDNGSIYYQLHLEELTVILSRIETLVKTSMGRTALRGLSVSPEWKMLLSPLGIGMK